jgi:hypothetical protein
MQVSKAMPVNPLDILDSYGVGLSSQICLRLSATRLRRFAAAAATVVVLLQLMQLKGGPSATRREIEPDIHTLRHKIDNLISL